MTKMTYLGLLGAVLLSGCSMTFYGMKPSDKPPDMALAQCPVVPPSPTVAATAPATPPGVKAAALPAAHGPL